MPRHFDATLILTNFLNFIQINNGALVPTTTNNKLSRFSIMIATGIGDM